MRDRSAPEQRREDIRQARSRMKLSCMNVRGGGMGKFHDVCRELHEWSLDLVGITETHLRDVVQMEGSGYVMVRKACRKQEKT